MPLDKIHQTQPQKKEYQKGVLVVVALLPILVVTLMGVTEGFLKRSMRGLLVVVLLLVCVVVPAPF